MRGSAGVSPIKVRRRPEDKNGAVTGQNSSRMSGIGEQILKNGKAYSFKSETANKKTERKAVRISSRMRSSLPDFNMYKTMSSIDQKTNYTSIDTESSEKVRFSNFRIF